MKTKIKKRKRQHKYNWFHIYMFVVSCFATYILLHDLLVWAIIPLFTGDFVMLTYFGMFVDLTAIGLIDLTIQAIKEY